MIEIIIAATILIIAVRILYKSLKKVDEDGCASCSGKETGCASCPSASCYSCTSVSKKGNTQGIEILKKKPSKDSKK